VQRWKIPTQTIYSQNARGLKTNSALTEAIDALRRCAGFSAGLHETWRTGLEIEEDGFVFLGAAPAVQNGRGSKGVGILLSPLAVAAWRAAGAVVHNPLCLCSAEQVKADRAEKKRLKAVARRLATKKKGCAQHRNGRRCQRQGKPQQRSFSPIRDLARHQRAANWAP